MLHLKNVIATWLVVKKFFSEQTNILTLVKWLPTKLKMPVVALVDALKIDMKPNALSMKLNVNASRLHRDYSIRYKCSRSHAGRSISLKLIAKDA